MLLNEAKTNATILPRLKTNLEWLTSRGFTGTEFYNELIAALEAQEAQNDTNRNIPVQG
jgi:hypothetical protein